MYAFPRPASEAHMHGMHKPQEGMTLRDYFAAKAMQALITSRHTDYENGWYEEGRVASSAYNLADAMMEARNAAQ